jgi:site-specific recombinase XerD
MTILNNSEINDICIGVMDNLYYQFPTMWEAYRVMYKTGCRVSELIDKSKWSISVSGIVTLIPNKRNSPRTFNSGIFSQYFINLLTSSEMGFFGRNTRYFNYYFVENIGTKKLYCKNKHIACHLFRHNYAKILHDNGWSDEDIKINFGDRSVIASNQYVYSEIIEDIYTI